MDQSLISAVYTILIAFVVNIVLCPLIIPHLVRLKFGQNVRSDGPQTHLKKSGTPTMGGIIILLSFVIASIWFIQVSHQILILILVTIGYGLIGFADDYIKVVKKRSMGLTAKQKILAQCVVTALFVTYLHLNDAASYSSIFIPFTNELQWNMGILFLPFVFIFMIGSVNSVNLTDGLDGLASGITVLVSTFLLFIAWAMDSSLVPIAGAAVGSLLGFLLFNSYPAKVFMGDTGSLALGGFVAATAILLHVPLFFILVGFIYVLEALSVIIQVGYFKLTNGKRFFKMAPLHHHFEQSGWTETKVVTLFYIVTAILCLVGFLGAQNIFF